MQLKLTAVYFNIRYLPCDQILFERVTFDQEELREAIRIIDKDVPRTNRDLSYYQ